MSSLQEDTPHPNTGGNVESIAGEVIVRDGPQRNVRKWTAASFKTPGLARRFQNLCDRAQHEFLRKNFKEAKRIAKEAFGIYADPSIMSLLADIANAEGHFDMARDCMLVQASLAKDMVLWKELLQEFITNNQYFRATYVLKKMVFLLPSSAQEERISYLLQLGDLYVTLGETARAITAFQKVWQMSNYSHFEVFSTLSSLFFQQGKWSHFTNLIKQALLHFAVTGGEAAGMPTEEQIGVSTTADDDDEDSSSGSPSSSVESEEDDELLLDLRAKSKKSEKAEKVTHKTLKLRDSGKSKSALRAEKVLRKKAQKEKRKALKDLKSRYGAKCKVTPFAKSEASRTLLKTLFESDSNTNMVDVLLNRTQIVESALHQDGINEPSTTATTSSVMIPEDRSKDEFDGFFDDDDAPTTASVKSYTAPVEAPRGTFGSLISFKQVGGTDTKEEGDEANINESEQRRRDYYTKLINVFSELLLERGQFTECIKVIHATARHQFGIDVQDLPIDLRLKLGLAYAYDGDTSTTNELFRQLMKDCNPSQHADVLFDAAEALYRIGMYELPMSIFQRLLRFARVTDNNNEDEEIDLSLIRDRDAGFLFGYAKCAVKWEDITDYAQRWRDAVLMVENGVSSIARSLKGENEDGDELYMDDDDYEDDPTQNKNNNNMSNTSSLPSLARRIRNTNACLTCSFRSRFYICRECKGVRRIEGKDIENLRHPAMEPLEELLYTLDPFNTPSRMLLASMLIEGYGDFTGAEELLLPPKPLHMRQQEHQQQRGPTASSPTTQSDLNSSLLLLKRHQENAAAVPLSMMSESGFQRFECDGALTFLYFNWARFATENPLILPSLNQNFSQKSYTSLLPLSKFSDVSDIWIACVRVGSPFIGRLIKRDPIYGHSAASFVDIMTRRLLVSARKSGAHAVGSSNVFTNNPAATSEVPFFDVSWIADEGNDMDDEDNWGRMSMAPGTSVGAAGPAGSGYSHRSALHLPTFTRASSAIVPVDRLAASLSGDLAASVGSGSGVASSIKGGMGMSTSLNQAIATSHRAGQSKNSVMLAARGVSISGSTLTSVVAGSRAGSSIATTALTAKRNAMTGGATTVLSSRTEGGKTTVVEESLLEAISNEKDGGGIHGIFRFNRSSKNAKVISKARAMEKKQQQRRANNTNADDDKGSVGNLSDLEDCEEDGGHEPHQRPHEGLNLEPIVDEDGFAVPFLPLPSGNKKKISFGEKRPRDEEISDDGVVLSNGREGGGTAADSGGGDDVKAEVSDGENEYNDDMGEPPSLEEIAKSQFGSDPELAALFLRATTGEDHPIPATNNEEDGTDSTTPTKKPRKASINSKRGGGSSTHNNAFTSDFHADDQGGGEMVTLPRLPSSTQYQQHASPSSNGPPEYHNYNNNNNNSNLQDLPTSIETSIEEFQHKRRPVIAEYRAMLKKSGAYGTSTMSPPSNSTHCLTLIKDSFEGKSTHSDKFSGGSRTYGGTSGANWSLSGKYCNGLKRIMRITVIVAEAYRAINRVADAHAFLSVFNRMSGSISKTFLRHHTDTLILFLHLTLEAGKHDDAATVIKKILVSTNVLHVGQDAHDTSASTTIASLLKSAPKNNVGAVSIETAICDYLRVIRSSAPAVTYSPFMGEVSSNTTIRKRNHKIVDGVSMDRDEHDDEGDEGEHQQTPETASSTQLNLNRAVWGACAFLINTGLRMSVMERVLDRGAKLPEGLIIMGNRHFIKGSYKCSLRYYVAALNLIGLQESLALQQSSPNQQNGLANANHTTPPVRCIMDPLLLLQIGVSYLYISENRRVRRTHECVQTALYYFQEYHRLVMATTPSKAPEAFYNVARAYHHVQLLYLATPIYEKCIKQADEDLRLLHADLATGYLSTGEETVRQHLNSLSSVRAAAGFNLGLIYGKMGRNEPLGMSKMFVSGW